MSDFLDAGRLEDHPFAELSGLVFQGNRTGELNLESGERHRTVWFLGGNPVAVVSPDPQDHLAQFLLEHGKISEDDARRLSGLPDTREALGSADFLPKETLNWGVKSRFVNLCYDLFRWEDGDYSFREGDPPRDLFLLKVPAHSLIFKGVGLQGQAAVSAAVPDDAVCGAGPVAASDARYLSPEAIQLLEQCQPGKTVAEALGDGSADMDQSRRLLYALTCLGLVTLSRGQAVEGASIDFEDERPGFMLDEGGADDSVTAPAPAAPTSKNGPGGFSLEEERTDGEFALNLPPLSLDHDASSGAGSEFNPAGSMQQPGNYPFEEDSGSGSFGSLDSFNTESTQDHDHEPPEKATGAGSKRSGSRFHIPRIVGIALGSVAALGFIAFAGWWWLSGSEPPPPAVKPPVKRPVGGGNVVPPPAPVPEPSAQPVVAAPTPPPPAPPAPVASVAPTPPTSDPPIPAAATRPLPTPAPAASAPAPRSPGVASGGGGTDRQRRALELFRSGDLAGAAAIWEALLAGEHRGAFTLQILTACEHDTIRDAQSALTAEELYLVTRKVKGRLCYRVCLGTFPSAEAAGRALAGLPNAYRAGGASIRPVADVLDQSR